MTRSDLFETRMDNAGSRTYNKTLALDDIPL
jgi:hypothetical protein